MERRKALIVGSSGLVGSYCLQELLKESTYDTVIALNRKRLAVSDKKLVQHLVDFDRLDDYKDIIHGNDVYCTLGTTIRRAGSRENFRKVDFDYPLRVAQIAALNGAKRLAVVTAIGANPASRFFYLRVKGELEAELSKLPFKALHLIRPAWLVGKRSERRLREEFGIAIGKFFSLMVVGRWKNLRSTEASTVARAMVVACLSDLSGVQIHKTTDLWSLGAR